MERRFRSITLLMLCVVMLTGCWDLKSIQDLNYLTAVGFDYEDGKYVVYVQMLDFSSVAKSETGKSTQPIPVWVGKGKGRTPNEAFNNLYRSSQMRIFYGQISAMVISDRLMKHGLADLAEMPRRYYEMRYTPWVFGSKLPIGELFAVTPFFNLSPMLSLLHQPLESYKQESLVAPISLREFIANYSEPGRTTMLPSLSITDKAWKSGQQPSPMLEIDGLFAFRKDRYCGWLGMQDLRGLRWVESKTRRSPLLLVSQGETIGLVSLETPKIRLTPLKREGGIRFKVSVKLTGFIIELMEQLPEQDIERLAETFVGREIRDTYTRGLAIRADLLQLEHALYRKRNREWKSWKQETDGLLQPDSLAEVEVRVRLQHAGKLKW